VKPLRVVLDTNTLVSALLFRRDNWSWLRSAWKDGSVFPILCAATTLELMTVLHYPKFRLSQTDQMGFLEEILPYCITSPNPEHRADLVACRDPKDQVFLDLALGTGVDFLVSGDKDLLEYPPVDGLKIISASSLRSVLEQ